MIKEYKCKIETDLEIFSKDPSSFVYEIIKNFCFTNDPFSDLDKWFYFYINDVTDLVTIWQSKDNLIYLEPGMHRFIGRSLKGKQWLDARLMTENKPNFNHWIKLSDKLHNEYEVEFPMSFRSLNNALTRLGENREPNDFWDRELPKFFNAHSIEKHRIVYNERNFFINRQGENEHIHDIKSSKDFLPMVKSIFESYV